MFDNSCFYPYILRKILNMFPIIFLGLGEEGVADLLSSPSARRTSQSILMKMLVSAPYKVPKKKIEREAKKTRGGLHHHGAPDTKSEDSNAHSSSEEHVEEETNLPQGEGRKERPPTPWRPIRLRGEKLLFKRSPPAPPIAARSGIPGPSPW